MASISKYTINDGTELYRVSIFIGNDPQTGKKKYKAKRGIRTKKEATIIASRMELQAINGDLEKSKPKLYLFSEVYQEWYDNYITTVQESTYNRTAGMFNNHILPFFGDKRIATITTRDVQIAVKDWATNTTANYKRWYNYTVAVMDYAVRQEYMDKNPAKAVMLPKKREKPGDKPDKFWDQNNMNTFLTSIDKVDKPEIYTMFRTLAFTGMRRGELLALEWSDVDFQQSTIRINKTLTQGMRGRQIVQATKTRAGKRTIPVDSVTMNQLKDWKHIQAVKYFKLGYNTNNDGQLIFASYKNGYKSLNTPAKRLRKIIKDNNLTLPTFSIHGFRRSYISNLLRAGENPVTVQHLVGHATIEITLEVYARINEQDKREATDRLLKFMEI